MKELSKEIQNRITSISNDAKAKWLENYVKHNIKSKGVGIPEIREIVKSTNKEFKISDQPLEKQVQLLNDLMYQEYTEDKLAAVIFLQLFWKNKNIKESLDMISKWFDLGYIQDWNVCDWLCVRVLSPMVDHQKDHTILELKKWNKDTNLWKARASLVPFAQSKTIKDHKIVIHDFATELIVREERFCKTAVGWVLREYSKIDEDYVRQFLSDYKNWITNEVMKNATKYLNQ